MNGIQVRVQVGTEDFLFVPTGEPIPDGAEVTYRPVIDDPMMREVVRAALCGALTRLEQQ